MAERAIRAHMAFLAHDLLEGLKPGSRGYDIAVNHGAMQFADADQLAKLEAASARELIYPYAIFSADVRRMTFVAGRRQDALEETIEGRDGMYAATLDVEDPAAVEAFGERLLAEHPTLNVLANNAGIRTVTCTKIA